MRIALTGATGLVGFPIAAALAAAGHAVTALGRGAPRIEGVAHAPWSLGTPAPVAGAEALVHAGFSHVPGRYRGGEGDDPDGFVRANGDGTRQLFEDAARAGVGRILFLSTRAVYGAYPPGTPLTEAMPPNPDTLYGTVKHDAERALAALARPGLAPVSLRATGVYGPPVPGRAHKWDALLDDFEAGQPITPRAGTEVHADDLAAAILRLLALPEAAVPGVLNVSDIVLDRRDLLAGHAALTGCAHPLPARADAAALSVMECSRLRALGWTPRGMAGVQPVLRALVERRRTAPGCNPRHGA